MWEGYFHKSKNNKSGQHTLQKRLRHPREAPSLQPLEQFSDAKAPRGMLTPDTPDSNYTAVAKGERAACS